MVSTFTKFSGSLLVCQQLRSLMVARTDQYFSTSELVNHFIGWYMAKSNVFKVTIFTIWQDMSWPMHDSPCTASNILANGSNKTTTRLHYRFFRINSTVSWPRQNRYMISDEIYWVDGLIYRANQASVHWFTKDKLARTSVWAWHTRNFDDC